MIINVKHTMMHSVLIGISVSTAQKDFYEVTLKAACLGAAPGSLFSSFCVCCPISAQVRFPGLLIGREGGRCDGGDDGEWTEDFPNHRINVINILILAYVHAY